MGLNTLAAMLSLIFTTIHFSAPAAQAKAFAPFTQIGP
jgi:hypothetical protein